MMIEQQIDRFKYIGCSNEEEYFLNEIGMGDEKDWEKIRLFFRFMYDKPDIYKLEEFKSWWLLHHIPIWSVHGETAKFVFPFLKSQIEPFLRKTSNEDRWRIALTHDKDFYYNADDVLDPIHLSEIGGIGSEITIAIHVLHWIILNQLSIDPKDLDFIVEFGGGVGHIPKLVKQLEFCGKYAIFDFPELAIIQQFYNNMKIEVMSHFSLLNLFLNNVSGNGLFYSTWGFSEFPLHLREKIEMELFLFKYCCILYQHDYKTIDNSKYFNDFMIRNTDFDWVKINLTGYDNNEDNTYLIGVNKNYARKEN
jgi:hypothetical protein